MTEAAYCTCFQGREPECTTHFIDRVRYALSARERSEPGSRCCHNIHQSCCSRRPGGTDRELNKVPPNQPSGNECVSARSTDDRRCKPRFRHSRLSRQRPRQLGRSWRCSIEYRPSRVVPEWASFRSGVFPPPTYLRPFATFICRVACQPAAVVTRYSAGPTHVLGRKTDAPPSWEKGVSFTSTNHVCGPPKLSDLSAVTPNFGGS